MLQKEKTNCDKKRLGHLMRFPDLVTFSKSVATQDGVITGVPSFSHPEALASLCPKMFGFALLPCALKKLICLFRILNVLLYNGCHIFDLLSRASFQCSRYVSLNFSRCFVVLKKFLKLLFFFSINNWYSVHLSLAGKH